MQVVTRRSALTPILLRHRAEGRSIGFVPTMGALHEGHLSLIAESRKRADITVASVFVNPTQFNDAKDLEKYPRQPEIDAQMLEKAGCDYLYLPGVDDVYPTGMQEGAFFDFRGLDTRLEGASRPGHFAGVAQVVKVLIETAVPDFLCMGQKDYQQCMIIRQLLVHMGRLAGEGSGKSDTPEALPADRDGDINTTDRTRHLTDSEQLWSPGSVRLIICPIIREPHGLAMSSRNERLSPALRQRAGAIFATLGYARTLEPFLSPQEVSSVCTHALNSMPDFQVDYFLLLDGETLEPVHAGTTSKVIITSVIAGGVRLLDNLVV